MKTTRTVFASTVVAATFICLGYLIACDLRWAKWEVKQENAPPDACDNLEANENRMCNYRLYVPSYEICYEKPEVTHWNCTSSSAYQAYRMVYNGVCSQAGICNGGTESDSWGTNTVNVVASYYRYCGYY